MSAPEALALERDLGFLVLRLRALRLGRDWCVALSGGEEHIGAASLAHARPSLTGRGTSATASVLARDGHKEDELAREAALLLAARLAASVAVVCGVHLDRAGAEQIRAVSGAALDLCRELAARLSDG